MTTHDRNGQPVVANFNKRKTQDRQIDELIGLCRGVVCDGVISHVEADHVLGWLNARPELHDFWPAGELKDLLDRCLEDGIFTEEEAEECKTFVLEITGMEKATEDGDLEPLPNYLPLTEPPPKVIFQGKNFCFTGRFETGSRKECEAAVIERGGSTQSGPTRTTDYLVIGSGVSRDWTHTSYGRKIEKVVIMQREGKGRACIISETHWHAHL